MAKAQTKSNFQILMAHENMPFVLVQQNFTTELEAVATVNAMAQALGIAQFRGLAKFLITGDSNPPHMAEVIGLAIMEAT